MSDSTNTRPPVYTHRNRRVHIPDGHIAVGLIVGVHGLRGEVKIELHTDFPERFDVGNVLLMGDDLAPMTIRQSRPHKQNVLVMFEGVKGREAADALRNRWLFVPEADALDLDEDTYWIHDIVGLTVQTVAGEVLGVVSDVMETGANDVYIVRTQGGVNQGRDLLLPAIEEVVQQVDLEAGRLIVDLPEGLLEA